MLSPSYCLCTFDTSIENKKILSILRIMNPDSSKIGPIRDCYECNAKIKRKKEYKKIDKHIALLTEDLYLSAKEFLDSNPSLNIKLTKYELGKNDFAYEDASVMHFFYPVKTGVGFNDIMNKKLEVLVDFGYLEPNSWFIHENNGICEFSPIVSYEKRAIIKILCDYYVNFRVSWCRNPLYNSITKFYENK